MTMNDYNNVAAATAIAAARQITCDAQCTAYKYASAYKRKEIRQRANKSKAKRSFPPTHRNRIGQVQRLWLLRSIERWNVSSLRIVPLYLSYASVWVCARMWACPWHGILTSYHRFAVVVDDGRLESHDGMSPHSVPSLSISDTKIIDLVDTLTLYVYDQMWCAVCWHCVHGCMHGPHRKIHDFSLNKKNHRITKRMPWYSRFHVCSPGLFSKMKKR